MSTGGYLSVFLQRPVDYVLEGSRLANPFANSTDVFDSGPHSNFILRPNLELL